MNVTKEECNLECEKALRKILHKLEEQFREHYIFFKETVEEQKKLLDAMWVLCSRCLILTRGAICVRPYPNEPTNREEREIGQEFTRNKDLLQQANSKLTASLYTVKEVCEAFDRGLAKVDASLPCSIVEGDQTRQPIYYYIDLFSDLFKFFHKIQNQLNLLGRFLMVEDIGSILEYKHLLEQDKTVYQYFEHCLNIENKLEA